MGEVLFYDAVGGFIGLRIALWVTNVIVHIVFAVGVFQDAKDRTLCFANPLVWTAATLIGGPLLAVGYWLVHSSKLALAADESVS